jgi:hypothetical protein
MPHNAADVSSTCPPPDTLTTTSDGMFGVRHWYVFVPSEVDATRSMYVHDMPASIE